MDHLGRATLVQHARHSNSSLFISALSWRRGDFWGLFCSCFSRVHSAYFILFLGFVYSYIVSFLLLKSRQANTVRAQSTPRGEVRQSNCFTPVYEAMPTGCTYTNMATGNENLGWPSILTHAGPLNSRFDRAVSFSVDCQLLHRAQVVKNAASPPARQPFSGVLFGLPSAFSALLSFKASFAVQMG